MKNIILMLAMFFAITIPGCSCGTVEPGNRGLVVNWGQVEENVLQEGFHTFCFFGCDLHEINVRQQRQTLDAPCFSSDLQQVDVKVSVLYRIPEANVVKVFREFHSEPFDILLAPRVQESIKEATATRSAEMIIKQREQVKAQALAALREKVGDILIIEDLSISDVTLSKQLSSAIEAKMVQEQESEKAKFTKQKAEIEAQMAVETAKGLAESNLTVARAEAESIKIRGEALRQNPNVVELQLIEKWNGVSPQIVSGSASGVSLLLPASK